MKKVITRLAVLASIASVLISGQSARAAASPCQVTKAKLISKGGDQDWSRRNGLIVFDQTDANGIYQLRTIKPGRTLSTCLSCTAVPGAPPPDRHKFNPRWTPNGRFIVVQGEIANNPLDAARNNIDIAELFLNGVWNDLYATTPTGNKWYKLTNTQITKTDGVLGPSFSPDGTKLFWSRLLAPASTQSPWGVYHLMMANFVVRHGIPSLQKTRDITPPTGGNFYEAHGFSPNGRVVLFSSDAGAAGKYDMNIWSMNLGTRKTAELTQNGSWNEHAEFTLNGKKIVYMSTQPYPAAVLKSDLMDRARYSSLISTRRAMQTTHRTKARRRERAGTLPVRSWRSQSRWPRRSPAGSYSS
jgi:hypothetical protein